MSKKRLLTEYYNLKYDPELLTEEQKNDGFMYLKGLLQQGKKKKTLLPKWSIQGR